MTRLHNHVVVHREAIGLYERQRFGVAEIPIERVLEAIVARYPLLLYGSDARLAGGTVVLPDRNTGLVTATHMGAIAILRGVFSGQAVDKVAYPLNVTPQQPLVVRVINPRPAFFRARGYVYFVDRRGFRNYPTPSWQWINKSDCDVLGRIEVERLDFHYEVRSVSRL